MNDLAQVAPAFVQMAHSIVWCSTATVDPNGRPRSRMLHPIWEWNGETLVGWVATSPTALKRAHLHASPYMSLNYWSPSHDTCVAECRATWILDDDGRRTVWDRFLNAPPPLGYNPTIVAPWTSPTCDAFAGIQLKPWRLRVFPGTLLKQQGGQLLAWRDPDEK